MIRTALTASIAISFAAALFVFIGYSMGTKQATLENRALIQRTNRNTARAIARQRRDMESLKPQAPCDLTGYVFTPVGE